MHMQRRTTILIIVLCIIFGLCILIALRLWQQKAAMDQQAGAGNTPMTKTIASTATLSFNPSRISVVRSGTTPTTVDIMLDAGQHTVSGAQIELYYDNKALQNVTIDPAQTSIFGTFGSDYTLISRRVENSLGRVTLWVGILPTNKTPRNGYGKVATLSFRAIPTSTATTTPIAFLNKSIVTQTGVADSVMKSGDPLIITIQ